MEAIAIIPARGGSKRIPRKNILPFSGKPMISYAIKSALESNCFKKVVVSTDDDEIAAIAESHGAWVPFRRSAKLSDDFTGTADVIRDAIHQLDSFGEREEAYCCIYATVPLLLPEMLIQARENLEVTGRHFVFAACEFDFPIQRAVKMRPGGFVAPFDPYQMKQRSQDLEPAYRDAGQFYWGTREAWLSEETVYDGNGKAYLIPRHRAVDIDTKEDWELAEHLLHALSRGQK